MQEFRGGSLIYVHRHLPIQLHLVFLWLHLNFCSFCPLSASSLEPSPFDAVNSSAGLSPGYKYVPLSGSRRDVSRKREIISSHGSGSAAMHFHDYNLIIIDMIVFLDLPRALTTCKLFPTCE